MPEWLDRLLRKPPRDRKPPEAFTSDGETTLALGKLTIPLAHTGKDVSGNTETWGTTYAKLYKNPGKTPVTCTATWSGAAPSFKCLVTANDVDYVAGTTFEVSAVDAAGNEGPALVVSNIASVDANAPVAFTADGQATFTPK